MHVSYEVWLLSLLCRLSDIHTYQYMHPYICATEKHVPSLKMNGSFRTGQQLLESYTTYAKLQIKYTPVIIFAGLITGQNASQKARL